MATRSSSNLGANRLSPDEDDVIHGYPTDYPWDGLKNGFFNDD